MPNDSHTMLSTQPEATQSTASSSQAPPRKSSKTTAGIVVRAIGLAGAAYCGWHLFFGGASAAAIYNCGEPLVIESCDNGDFGPTCRIRNIGQVPLGSISAWAYDNTGTQINSPLEDTDLDGLSPGAVVKTDIDIPDPSQAATVVLCSVDPKSSLGSGRFGIGAMPH